MVSSSGNSCYTFPHLLFLPLLPKAYVLLFQLGLNVLSSFLYFSLSLFQFSFSFFFFFSSTLKLQLTKGASLFNSCLEISTQWMQTAGAAWVAVSDASPDIVAQSATSPLPPRSLAPLVGAANSVSQKMLIFGMGTECFGAEHIAYVFTPESFSRRELRCFLLCTYMELFFFAWL